MGSKDAQSQPRAGLNSLTDTDGSPNMETAAQDLKELLLCCLEGAVTSPDITAQQQMGVSISSAAKREGGVVIFQNQSVEIFAKVVPNLTKAIRICDQLISSQKLIELKPLPVVEEDNDPIEDCCAFMFEQKIKWEEMQELMRARYLEYVVNQFKLKIDAAKFLDVGPTYLSKIIMKEEKKK